MVITTYHNTGEGKMSKLNRKVPYSVVLTLLLALVMSLACGTAMAQDDDDEFLLEEIVVTAEFREKAIQDTPLAITAVNAETMEARSQFRLEEIALQAPNVSLRPGNATYGASMTAYIRGVGQVDFNPSVEAGVGIYVDDVYYATITGNLLDLLDLERVEILRGPQGTLAGRNALGGAIKMFSKKPTGDGSGSVSVTAGSYDRIDLKAAADFAISDTLFMRIAGSSRAREGYVKSYDYACTHSDVGPYGTDGGMPSYLNWGTGHSSGCELAREGDQSVTAGRLSLRWMPSDVFEANFSMNIVNDNSGSTPSVLLSARNMATNPEFIPLYFDNNGNGRYEAGIDVPYDDRFVTAGTFYNYATYIDDGRSLNDERVAGAEGLSIYKPNPMPRVNTLDAKDYTLSLDWNLTDNLALKSITSYREYFNAFSDDADGSPIAVQQLLQRMDHSQFTQELRLNANLFDGFADTTIGVFYLDAQTDEDARVNINYSALDFIHGPDKVPSKSQAVYGQATMHLTDRMDLTLGLRYSQDEKEYTFQRHNPDGSLISFADPTLFFDLCNTVANAGLPCGIVQIPGFAFDPRQPANAALAASHAQYIDFDSDRWDWRVALDYDLTDNLMVYGQIATGYRAGGMNARPFYPSQLANTVDPEELTNYEVGFKSTLWDQLRLNVSAFFNDYKDIQLNVESCFLAAPGEESPCAAQYNVGDGEVKGFEVEGVWRPTSEFLLDFSYSFLDFEYTDIATYVNADGETVLVSNATTTPYTPENKWSLGAQYRFDMGSKGSLTIRGDASFQDDVETVGFVGQGYTIEDYTLVNGRLSWQSADAEWEISMACTNLTDEYYYLTVYDLQDSVGSIFQNAQPGRPIEWAFTIKRTWF